MGCAADLWRVRAEIDRGRASLTELSVEQLDGDLEATIDDAVDHLDRADVIADRSVFLSTVGIVPGVADQVRGLRRLTEAAADLGASARIAAAAVVADLDRATGDPAARLDLLDTIERELDRVEADAGSLELGDGRRLLGPLGRARLELQGELDRLPDRFDDARSRLGALERLLRGPSRYLVLAANNAEMRGGSGMPLSGGVLAIEDGDLEFGDFEQTANRFTGPIDASVVPASYEDTYRQFRIGQSWLQTAVSPNFAAVGPIYDAMSAASAFGAVDGVIVVDAVALRHILAAIGPVEVDGVRYSAENVERILLNEDYLAAEPTVDGRLVRREQQGAVAREIFDAMQERDVDVGALSAALRDAASGRHLLAYSDDPALHPMFEDLGAAGRLDPRGLMVTVQNIAADKLDWYISPTVTVRAVRSTSTDPWAVRLTVRVPNPEREGDTVGVESAKPEIPPGLHRALVAVYLPEAAFDISTAGGEVSEAGADPPMWMVGQRIFVEEGDVGRVFLEFSLPPDHGGFTVLPSARVRPMAYQVNGIATDDAVARFVPFEEASSAEDLPGPPVVAALLAIAGIITLTAGHRRALHPARRPLVAPSPAELRLPTLGLVLLAAAGATLIAASVFEALRPR